MGTHETRISPLGDQQVGDGRSLSERIECHVHRRLCGRVYHLHVVRSADQILVQGRSRTYYEKQLAQEAVLELTGGALRLVNEIAVG